MSTASIVERIRAARAQRTALRIRGAGTWMDAGRPVRGGDVLSVGDDRGIVEYVPGDLTLTARAGTPLDEIDRATRENGQWLPLSPWGAPTATLGATVSTATAGPFAAAFGLPRDATLGLEFVTGAGDVVRSGGRVVKNVAGFDLTRLLTGSWGTLGVITEVTVRLRALPQHSRTIAIRIDDTPAAISAAARHVRELPFAPFASELVNPALAAKLGLDHATALLVELGGNATAVSAQLDALTVLGPSATIDADVWDRLRGADAGAASSWRMSSKPTEFPAVWKAASVDGALVHGSFLRGVVRVISPSAATPVAPPNGRLVVERLPRDRWTSRVDRSPLAESVRSRFDPDGILNPGIFGEVA